MLRALLAIAAIPAAAFAIAIPAPAAADSGCTTAPIDVLTAGPFYTAPLDPIAQDQTTTPGVPEPPKPTCYGCPTGYHCAHNPERCVAD
jgi:hypothetical protein